MNPANDLTRIEAKLDILIRLLALAALPDNLSLMESAVRLQRAGLTPKETAALLGTTANTVSVALSKVKRAAKAKSGDK